MLLHRENPEWNELYLKGVCVSPSCQPHKSFQIIKQLCFIWTWFRKLKPCIQLVKCHLLWIPVKEPQSPQEPRSSVCSSCSSCVCACVAGLWKHSTAAPSHLSCPRLTQTFVVPCLPHGPPANDRHRCTCLRRGEMPWPSHCWRQHFARVCSEGALCVCAGGAVGVCLLEMWSNL